MMSALQGEDRRQGAEIAQKNTQKAKAETNPERITAGFRGVIK